MDAKQGGVEVVLAEFSVAPVGKGESLSEFVAECMKIVEASGLDYRMNAMGTVLLGDRDRVIDTIMKCHKRVMEMAPRVLTTIRIDDRRGVQTTLDSKIKSVEKILGKEVRK